MPMIDDPELARRSILNFAELLALWGESVPGAVAIHHTAALGARLPAAGDNPWFDAVVVPPGAAPPADDPALPLCVWTRCDSVPGRTAADHLVMPVMGIALDGLTASAPPAIAAPALAEVGALNERAYGMAGYAALFAALARRGDPRLRTHGLHRDGAFVCVAVTLAIGDDIGIHYVATEAAQRRQGLATQLLRAVLAEARAAGARTATLQASPDGVSVYAALGFRQVALLRGFLRPAPAPM